MKHFIATILLSLSAVVDSGRANAAPTKEATCDLPPSLQSEVAKRYKSFHLVNLDDLNEDDRGKFLKDHDGDCPGIARLDFFGTGVLATALTLLSPDRAGAILIIARPNGNHWVLTTVDKAKTTTPVVWSEVPGKYIDVESGKALKAKYPVILWCEYDAWAIVYAQTGPGISKVWVAD